MDSLLQCGNGLNSLEEIHAAAVDVEALGESKTYACDVAEFGVPKTGAGVVDVEACWDSEPFICRTSFFDSTEVGCVEGGPSCAPKFLSTSIESGSGEMFQRLS